jgi:hypothetical protein
MMLEYLGTFIVLDKRGMLINIPPSGLIVTPPIKPTALMMGFLAVTAADANTSGSVDAPAACTVGFLAVTPMLAKG